MGWIMRLYGSWEKVGETGVQFDAEQHETLRQKEIECDDSLVSTCRACLSHWGIAHRQLQPYFHFYRRLEVQFSSREKLQMQLFETAELEVTIVIQRLWNVCDLILNLVYFTSFIFTVLFYDSKCSQRYFQGKCRYLRPCTAYSRFEKL